MGGGHDDLTNGEEASASEREEIRKRRSEVTAGLVATKPTPEVAQPAGAGKKEKKKKLVKTVLPPELVAEIIRRPVTPVRVIPDEMLPGFSERFRAAYARQTALAEELMAIDADIIRQYRDKGYAELEEEVTDEEEEN